MSNSTEYDPENVPERGGLPIWSRISFPLQKRIKHHTLNFFTLIGILIVVFPLFWMFSTALRPREALLEIPTPILPPELSLSNFENIIYGTKFVQFYINSILVSIGVVSITVIAATLGGYGLTRLDMPFKKTFARSILIGYMFPPILLAIPMFILWQQIGMINSYIGLIVAETAVALPFALWLMWKFFQTVPESLEESAQMAGASRFRAFYEIALPMAKPGMVAVGVFAYAVSWNQYTIPIVIMTEQEKWPLTVGVTAFTQQNQILWGQVMAASALVIIPSFIFVYFLQKYLLRGFRAGGMG